MLNIIWVITWRWIGGVRHVASRGETRSAYTVLVEEPQGQWPFGKYGHRWKDSMMRWYGLHSSCSGYSLGAGPCNRGQESSRSIKRRGFSRSRRPIVFSRTPLSYISIIQLNQIHIKHKFAIQLTVLHDESHEHYRFSLIFHVGCVHDDTLNSIPPTPHSRSNHSNFYTLNPPRWS